MDVLLLPCLPSSDNSHLSIFFLQKANNHSLPKPKIPSSSTTPLSSPLTISKNNLLLSSIAKSKPLSDVINRFRLLPNHHRDTVTWNTVISACLRHQRYLTAFHLFHDMLVSSPSYYQPPDNITILSVLKACVETNNTQLGFQLHAYVTKQEGLGSSDKKVMGTCLVNMYERSGLLDVAHQVFVRISHRDVVTFTSMMMGFSRAGEFWKALLVFVDMVETAGVVANEYALSCALCASAAVASLSMGRQIHAHVAKLSLESDVYVGTSLVDMYSKCVDIESARLAFSGVPDKNLATWNARMAGNLDAEEILALFLQMNSSGVCPDHVTFASVLRACKELGACLAQQVHGMVVKSVGVDIDVFVGESLFASYVRHGWINEALRIFSEINDKDVIAFNLVIELCSRSGYMEEAVRLLDEALQTLKELDEATITSLMAGVRVLSLGKQLHGLAVKLGFSSDSADSFLSTSLVAMYSKCHCVDDAVKIFERITSPDVASWTSLISCFSADGRGTEAINLYIKMLSEGPTEFPNQFTFSTLLNVCTDHATAEEGKQVHAQILKLISCTKADHFVATGLLNMYAKYGYIEEARRIFNSISDRDLPSWNAMIISLAEHGLAEEALELFDELLNNTNLKPNDITFLGVLSACNHCGMVEAGYHYFRLIREPTIDHYACLINLVARAGRLEEALRITEDMPFHPNEYIWSAFLGAAIVHENIEYGEYSATRLLELNPEDPGTYIALSNIYAAAGRWDDVKHIRKLMIDKGVRKEPGFSWLVLEGKNHTFFADNTKIHHEE